MKNWKLLIWIPQFGIAIASPFVLFMILSVWLRNHFSLGNWIIGIGLFCGMYTAYIGARDTLRAIPSDQKQEQKHVSFNEHM